MPRAYWTSLLWKTHYQQLKAVQSRTVQLPPQCLTHSTSKAIYRPSTYSQATFLHTRRDTSLRQQSNLFLKHRGDSDSTTTKSTPLSPKTLIFSIMKTFHPIFPPAGTKICHFSQTLKLSGKTLLSLVPITELTLLDYLHQCKDLAWELWTVDQVLGMIFRE